MYFRLAACIVLALCVFLWAATYVEIDIFLGRGKERTAKRIPPLYKNIKADRRLSHPEDAKFDEQTGQPVAYLRIFEEPHFLPVPRSWCLPSNQKNVSATYKGGQIQAGRPSEVLINTVVRKCFKDRDPNAHDRMKLWHSLRLLRDAFDREHITLILGFGSLLGSSRYHQRMFYDVDYDFLVHEHEMESAVGILAKLSANVTSEMRLVDARSSYGLPKFGFLCGNDPLWRKRDKRCVEMNGSHVVCNSMQSTAELIKPCRYYADFYWMRKTQEGRIKVYTLPITYAQEDVLQSEYRPLDGTLFRTVRNFDQYVIGMYGSSSSLCVPKLGRLNKTAELSEFISNDDLLCPDFAVPCAYIDEDHPQVYISADGRNVIQFGLHRLKSGECFAHSLFIKFK